MSKQAELEQARAQLEELTAKVARLKEEVKREARIGLPSRINDAEWSLFGDGEPDRDCSDCRFIFGNAFRDKDQASAFSHALSVLLRIRRCEEIVDPNGNAHWYIRVRFEDCEFSTDIAGGDDMKDADFTHCYMFPAFATRKHAERAVAEIGEENIIRAAKTLAFVGVGK